MSLEVVIEKPKNLQKISAGPFYCVFTVKFKYSRSSDKDLRRSFEKSKLKNCRLSSGLQGLFLGHHSVFRRGSGSRNEKQSLVEVEQDLGQIRC